MATCSRCGREFEDRMLFLNQLCSDCLEILTQSLRREAERTTPISANVSTTWDNPRYSASDAQSTLRYSQVVDRFDFDYDRITAPAELREVTVALPFGESPNSYWVFPIPEGTHFPADADLQIEVTGHPRELAYVFSASISTPSGRAYCSEMVDVSALANSVVSASHHACVVIERLLRRLYEGAILGNPARSTIVREAVNGRFISRESNLKTSIEREVEAELAADPELRYF